MANMLIDGLMFLLAGLLLVAFVVSVLVVIKRSLRPTCQHHRVALKFCDTEMRRYRVCLNCGIRFND